MEGPVGATVTKVRKSLLNRDIEDDGGVDSRRALTTGLQSRCLVGLSSD